MTRRVRASVLVAVGVAAAAIGACSSDDAGTVDTLVPTFETIPAATTTTTDPRTAPGFPRVCVMAAVEHLNQVVGFEAVNSQEGVLRGITTCLLFDAAGEKLAGVSVGPLDRFAEAQAAPDAVAVDGFGNDAVWTDDTLYVLMDVESMTFKLYPAAGVAAGDTREVVEAIAADALSRYEPPLEATAP